MIIIYISYPIIALRDPNKWTQLVPVLFVCTVPSDLSFHQPHPWNPRNYMKKKGGECRNRIRNLGSRCANQLSHSPAMELLMSGFGPHSTNKKVDLRRLLVKILII